MSEKRICTACGTQLPLTQPHAFTLAGNATDKEAGPPFALSTNTNC